MDKFLIIKKQIFPELNGIFFFSSQKKELDPFFHFHGPYKNSDSFRPFLLNINWSDSFYLLGGISGFGPMAKYDTRGRMFSH